MELCVEMCEAVCFYRVNCTFYIIADGVEICITFLGSIKQDVSPIELFSCRNIGFQSDAPPFVNLNSFEIFTFNNCVDSDALQTIQQQSYIQMIHRATDDPTTELHTDDP